MATAVAGDNVDELLPENGFCMGQVLTGGEAMCARVMALPGSGSRAADNPPKLNRSRSSVHPCRQPAHAGASHQTRRTMETSTIIAMVLIMGTVWGGFAILLAKALRAESHKRTDV